MEQKIIALIHEKGPLTGSEIMETLGGDGLILWRTCTLSKNLVIRFVGTRYMRLDRRIKGFARLSPSILREFLTYSVIGLAKQDVLLSQKTKNIALRIETISKAKLELAYSIVSTLVDKLECELPIQEQVCFIIGGDIVYNMAHNVPRPERSTGKLVNGSDMDLIVVVGDDFPKELVERIDEAIYKEKHRLLITPHLREEIDYVVKDLNRIREQIKFDTFKHMVACKLLHEGAFLYGSGQIFHTIKVMLKEHGVIQKLNALEEKARDFRKHSESSLLHGTGAEIQGESQYLFYPTEESEEFE
ncbi:MAG: hypothetical protein JW896_01955 [Deltaproteobacteria bacterium]|nr:hypothetical protein [Deltaproteobacteria bacterium]